MARQTCVKCDSTRFETNTFEPEGSRYKLTSVNCAKCGGVVGVLDYYNTGQQLQEIKKALGIA